MTKGQRNIPETAEPIYIAQSAEPMDFVGRRKWVKARIEDARRKGASGCRVTVDDSDNPKMILFEAWTILPINQGAPRWMLTLANVDQPK